MVVIVKGLTEEIVIIRGLMEKELYMYYHRQRIDGKKLHYGVASSKD
jgi:hypothetical protein